jgi:hypothetical protein
MKHPPRDAELFELELIPLTRDPDNATRLLNWTGPSPRPSSYYLAIDLLYKDAIRLTRAEFDELRRSYGVAG